MKWKESVFLISRLKEELHQFLVVELEKRNMKGLVPSHGDIINALRPDRELTMTDLAVKITRDRSTVTTLVEKLIRLGFVRSTVNPTDKRSSLVSLTEKGKDTKEDFEEISELMFEKMFRDIDEADREQWARMLTRILENF